MKMDRTQESTLEKWAKAQLSLLLGIILVPVFGSQPSAGGQNENWWGPAVRVLAEVEGSVFDWSPDGRRFAYADDLGIMLREAPDFREPRRMSLPGWDGALSITDLRWSPDGRRLAFVSPWKPGDWTTVWVSEPGGPVRDLLPPEVSNIFGSPGVRTLALGPWLNGSEIVFEQHCGTECLAVHKVHVDTRNYGTLCWVRVDGGIHWSPLKDRAIISQRYGALALAKREDFRPVVSGSVSESSCREALPGCSGESSNVGFSFESWSPDGKQVLLSRHSCPDGLTDVAAGPGELFLWKAGNEPPERLLANGALAAWSPSGSHIGFILLGNPTYDFQGRVVRSDLAAGRPFEAHLGIIDAATKSVRVLAPLGLIDPKRVYEWSFFRPVWSPDGQRIVYRDARNNLHVVHRDGSSRRLLVREKLSVVYWSPDSKRLAIRVNKRPDYWVGAETPYLVELDF